MEALGQNQGAIVWWKPLLPHEQESDGKEKVTSRGDKKKGASGGGVVASGEGGGNVEETGHVDDMGGSHLKTIGYVVCRYRLDGCEWHKKGATNVDGEKAGSTRVQGLQNGLVYR